MDPVAVRTVITTLGATPSLATIFGTRKFERLQARQIRNSNANAHLFEFWLNPCMTRTSGPAAAPIPTGRSGTW